MEVLETVSMFCASARDQEPGTSWDLPRHRIRGSGAVAQINAAVFKLLNSYRLIRVILEQAERGITYLGEGCLSLLGKDFESRTEVELLRVLDIT